MLALALLQQALALGPEQVLRQALVPVREPGLAQRPGRRRRRMVRMQGRGQEVRNTPIIIVLFEIVDRTVVLVIVVAMVRRWNRRGIGG